MQQRNPLAFSYISPYIQGTRRIKRITHNLKVKSPCIKVYRNPFPLFPVFLLSRDIMCKFLPRFFHTLRKKEKRKAALAFFLLLLLLLLLLFLHSSSNKFPCSKDAGQFLFIKIRHSEIFLKDKGDKIRTC